MLHQSDKAVSATEQWVLVCDHVLSKACEDGVQFQLKQADVSILCQVNFGWFIVVLLGYWVRVGYLSRVAAVEILIRHILFNPLR